MKRTFGILTVLALGACSSAPTVSRDYDPQKDFTPLKTWAWSPEPRNIEVGEIEASGLTQERIRAAIAQELSAKGLQLVDPANASLWVQYTAARRVVAGPRYNSTIYSDEDLYLVDVSTIAIDMTTPSDKRLVWRGVGYRTIDPEMKPQEREARIHEVVREILQTFPPKK